MVFTCHPPPRLLQGKTRWRAQLPLPNNNRYHIGYFDTQREAARAYDSCSIQTYGEQGYTNFPRSDYGHNGELLVVEQRGAGGGGQAAGGEAAAGSAEESGGSDGEEQAQQGECMSGLPFAAWMHSIALRCAVRSAVQRGAVCSAARCT